MNVRPWILVPALALAGCGFVRDLFGDDDDTPPPRTDPALQPPVNPPPVTPDPNTPSAGGLEIPGLPGLRLPLPIPDLNPPAREPPARGTLAPAPAGSYDAQGFMTRQFLEQEATDVVHADIAALWQHEREQVQSVPFQVVDEGTEPNAAAGCTRAGSPVVMITSAMLELCAGIAETKAYDELAGTNTYAQYVNDVIAQVRGERPITGPSAALLSGPNALDSQKLARQRHLFDEQIAFILGHEFAHHYRGHTGCVGGRTNQQIQQDEAISMLAHTVPPFEQPREIEADMWGATNVLEAGHNRPGGAWNEEGGLLNLDFFGRLANEGGPDLIMAFLSTHPPSVVRIPIVRSIAQQWTPGRRPPDVPIIDTPAQGGTTNAPGGLELPGGLRLPIDPSQLPIQLPPPQQ